MPHTGLPLPSRTISSSVHDTGLSVPARTHLKTDNPAPRPLLSRSTNPDGEVLPCDYPGITKGSNGF